MTDIKSNILTLHRYFLLPHCVLRQSLASEQVLSFQSYQNLLLQVPHSGSGWLISLEHSLVSSVLEKKVIIELRHVISNN